MANLTPSQLRTMPAWEISRWLLPWQLLRCAFCLCLHCFTTQFLPCTMQPLVGQCSGERSALRLPSEGCGSD